MSYRVRRVGRRFRVERNAGRGQIIVVDSFRLRSEADALIKQLNRPKTSPLSPLEIRILGHA